MKAPILTSTAIDPERARSLSADMLDRERWPRELLLAYQRDRLRETVRHAIAHSPYYRRTLGEIGNGHVDLHRLPILDKTTLMAHFDQIVTDPRLKLAEIERHLASDAASQPVLGTYRAVASGGTSGERGVVVYDQRAWELSTACVLRMLALQGVRPGDRVVGIGSPSPLHMTNRLFAELRAGRTDMPRLSVTTPMPDVVAALNSYRPDAMITYPSFLRRLIHEQQAGRLRIAPRLVSSTAETLAPDLRAMVKELWNAPVLVGYGTTEAGLIAGECPWANGPHVLEDMVLVEVVDENDRPVPAGVTGSRILVTTLFNRVLPLVRYVISDLVSVAEGRCKCGRPHLRLASIEGRREDLVRLPARGGEVTVHAFQFGMPLLRMPSISQYQVGLLSHGLVVKVVLRDGGPADAVLADARHAVLAELARVGATLEAVSVERVDRIERAGTGAKEKLVAFSA